MTFMRDVSKGCGKRCEGDVTIEHLMDCCLGMIWVGKVGFGGK